ncbi:tRNA (N(6)-L-threonylcarbamoyladenosine(37)-C(2))-methylthiotransferase [Candidatus Nitrosotenuis cloacae]|uniref:tRNA-t(6)A37 methylthiotransferase n=1 Tax=Candidatus Nitrosotenuis cloacae TaxID=1603555 RepID=A0A3G1B4I3_9ARCH|nr:tRNA (N(6)-L-threonylcarbamoyladenosine(37)-C(2))-methylthiotransferase [Candidatus Nitrosotenuis cloacae]AJZ76498.1 2-methylthioadenine synthetase [Candidatus Nitrosotenuis cloacae]
MAKIWVESYGCSASFADAEMISGLIVNGGHTLASSSKDSDLNLIVTCSVKDATANKMVNRIKRLKSKPLVVAGCLAKAEPKSVQKFSPNASLMGPNSIGKTLQIIDHTLSGRKKIELEDSDITKTGLPKVRLNPIVGIVEIASGCMSDCTFCQTKLARGDLQSYRLGDIVRQVEHEVNDGCKEIWLTSTDNGCYGLDIGTTLPELVNKVSEIPKEFMIRVGMMNPMYMPKIKNDLVESFENDKVFKFLHVPVQSGSNDILHEMKRGHTAETFRDVVKRFKDRFGRFTISTDIIVGFPGETEQDFADTVQLIKDTKPDVVNLSRYSQRPGTKAAEMVQLDVAKIKDRSKELFNLINQITLQNNQQWVGWSGEVLFDEQTDDMVRGRNFAYKPVFVDDMVQVGDKAKVKITRATNHGLYGLIAS